MEAGGCSKKEDAVLSEDAWEVGMSHPISDGRRIKIVVKHLIMKQNNSGKMQRNVGFGNMNVSVVYRRVWNIVDLKYWGTGNVLGQCGNEFWVNINSRRMLSIQDSLPHEFTKADSFHFIGVLLACARLILH